MRQKHSRAPTLRRREFCTGMTVLAISPVRAESAAVSAQRRIAQRAVAELPPSTIASLIRAACECVDSASDFRMDRTVRVGGVLFSASELGRWINATQIGNSR